MITNEYISNIGTEHYTNGMKLIILDSQELESVPFWSEYSLVK